MIPFSLLYVLFVTKRFLVGTHLWFRSNDGCILPKGDEKGKAQHSKALSCLSFDDEKAALLQAQHDIRNKNTAKSNGWNYKI
jgi:hypothetical protein